MDKIHKGELLAALHKMQKEDGYLKEDRLKKVSLQLNITLSQIYSVATFYSFFSVKKKGKHVIRVCSTPSCLINGSETIISALEKMLGIKCGETTKDQRFTLEKVSCIGLCDQAPALLLDNKPFTKLTREKLVQMIEHADHEEHKI